MFCPHCGNPTPNDKPFCVNCGRQVGGGDPFQPGGRQDAGYQQTDSPSYEPVYSAMVEPVRNVTFTEAVRSFFLNYVNFGGRATRSEYWFSALFVVAVDLVLTGLGNVFYDSFLGMVLSGLSWVFAVAVFLPQLSISWRRLHDTGKSGLWYFIAFVPLVGFIIAIVLYSIDSQEDNQYGPRRTDSNRMVYP